MQGENQILALFETSRTPLFHYFSVSVHGCSKDLLGHLSATAVADRLTVNDCIAAIHTVSDGAIEARVHITLVNARPTEALDRWDHVTGFSMNVTSGHLVVADGAYFPPGELVISLWEGTYRLRVHYEGIEEISAALSSNDDSAIEHVWITIWEEEYAEPVVLKRYVGQES